MGTRFQIGQTVSFKSVNKSKKQKESYFVVIQIKEDENIIVIEAINTNEEYQAGDHISVINPYEDLDFVEIMASDLINEKVIIKETLLYENVYGKVIRFDGKNKVLRYRPIGNFLISNVVYEFKSTIAFQ